EDLERNNNRESMFALNQWAAEYFQRYMHYEDEGRSVGLSYFSSQRGFSDGTIKRFGLGFCPSKSDKFSADARAAGYKPEFLLSTGLSIERETDGALRDRFYDRVMFPIHNISGRVVGFGGRTLRTTRRLRSIRTLPRARYITSAARYMASSLPRRLYSRRTTQSSLRATPMLSPCTRRVWRMSWLRRAHR
ncbi:MAG: hypothetical protein II204_00435, partial [Alistipes sp.]|nr:hypothetical protein [Alistipes sp.]